MFCRVMFLRCCSLLVLPETVLWGTGPVCCVGAVSDQCAEFDASLGWESDAMPPSVICPDTAQWCAWFIVVLMFLVGILVLCSAFSWGRSFVDAAMRVPRFQLLVIAAVLAASLVSLVLFVSFGSALSLVWRCRFSISSQFRCRYVLSAAVLDLFWVALGQVRLKTRSFQERGCSVIPWSVARFVSPFRSVAPAQLRMPRTSTRSQASQQPHAKKRSHGSSHW